MQAPLALAEPCCHPCFFTPTQFKQAHAFGLVAFGWGAPTSSWGSRTSNQVQMDLPGFSQRAGTAFAAPAAAAAAPDPGL